jgi:uncharacterized protein
MDFEWDENKNKINVSKHGLDFETVKLVFFDHSRKTSVDERKDYGEKRFITIGREFNTIIVVVYTFRGDKVRIISARLANEYERMIYLLSGEDLL